MGSLFPESTGFDREAFARKLSKLASEGIYIGGSSWKYDGWIGQIYSRDRYLTRGKFSQKKFDTECLSEYSEVFPIVCGDFAFYQFPTMDFWEKLFNQPPATVKFAFKVPEQITCKVFPSFPRYGALGGQENPSFLDAALFKEAFLRPLLRWRERIPVLILEFGSFPKSIYPNPVDFFEWLDSFLRALPREFQYSVEIRNAEYLVPEYFAILRANGVAHVYNAWARVPELHDQLQIPQADTAEFLVSRTLLRRGRSYEQAVKLYEPYTHIQDPNPAGRAALRELIARARATGRSAFLFVNNRFEGNAPETILAVISD